MRAGTRSPDRAPTSAPIPSTRIPRVRGFLDPGLGIDIPIVLELGGDAVMPARGAGLGDHSCNGFRMPAPVTELSTRIKVAGLRKPPMKETAGFGQLYPRALWRFGL